MWHYPGLWTCITLLLSAAVVATAPSRGAGRVVSITGLSVIMLLSIFVFRPLMATQPDYSFYGYDASSGARYASVVGLLAISGYSLGAVLTSMMARSLRHAPASNRSLKRSLKPRAGRRLILFCLAGCAAYTFILLLVGGPSSLVDFLIAGRSAGAAANVGGLPTIVVMISYAGSAGSAVFIAFHPTGKLMRGEVAAVLVATGIAFLFSTSTGNRRALIPILLIPAGAWVFRTKRTPPLRVFVAGLVALLFFLSLPFVRSQGARENSNVFQASSQYVFSGGISNSVKQFLVSYDTEMFNYIAYVGPRLGTSIPYGHGQAVFRELALFPLPSSMSPASLYSDVMLTRLYGGGCGQPFCPVPSAPGVLLFDFGYAGVFVGMLFLGVGMRAIETRAWRSRTPRSVIVGAVAFGYTPIFIRTYSPDAVWWSIYFLLLAYCAVRYLTSDSQDARWGRIKGDLRRRDEFPVNV